MPIAATATKIIYYTTLWSRVGCRVRFYRPLRNTITIPIQYTCIYICYACKARVYYIRVYIWGVPWRDVLPPPRNTSCTRSKNIMINNSLGGKPNARPLLCHFYRSAAALCSVHPSSGRLNTCLGNEYLQSYVTHDRPNTYKCIPAQYENTT